MSDLRLTADDLATRYGVSVFTIRRLAKSGLPHYRLGALYRFDPDDTDAWMRQRGTATGTDADDYRDSIKRLVDQAPPLTADQADRIRAILSGGVA